MYGGGAHEGAREEKRALVRRTAAGAGDHGKMRNQEVFHNAAGAPAHLPCSRPLTSQPTSGRERLDHIRCSTSCRCSGIPGGDSAFTKCRGGGMVTTAAGHLSSP